MLRTNLVRRAGRLLGAVTVTGVLATGIAATSAVPAHGAMIGSRVSLSANGIGSFAGLSNLGAVSGSTPSNDANGI